MVKLDRTEANYRSALGHALAGLGQKEPAIREATAAVELSNERHRGRNELHRLEDLAQVYVLVGEKSAALSTLERLAQMPGGFAVPFLQLDPIWNPIRREPRFQSLIAKQRAFWR
jgi:hypothetical protein